MLQYLPTAACASFLLVSLPTALAQGSAPGPQVVLERPETFSGMTSITFGPKQKLVAGGAAVFTLGGHKTGGDVLLWDLSKHKLLHTFKGHDTPVDAVAVNGKRLVSFSAQDADIRVWDTRTGKQLRRIDASVGGKRWESTRPALAHDGSLLLRVTKTVIQLAGRNDPIAGTLEAWDIDKGKLRWSREKTYASTLAISPNGKRVAYYAQELKWKVVDGEIHWSRPDRVVRVLEASDGSEVAVIHPDMEPVSGIAFLPKNRGLVLANASSLARYSMSSGKRIGKLVKHEAKMPVRAMQCSSDGKHVALYRQFANEVELWEVKRTPKRSTIAISDSAIAPVAFTPDLSKLACERSREPTVVQLVVEDKKKRRRR